MAFKDPERKKEVNKLHNRRHTVEHNKWLDEASDEQKRLWAEERKLHNKPEYREKYMAIVSRLQEFVPIDPLKVFVSKYSRIEKREGDPEGMRCHLHPRRFY